MPTSSLPSFIAGGRTADIKSAYINKPVATGTIPTWKPTPYVNVNQGNANKGPVIYGEPGKVVTPTVKTCPTCGQVIK